MDENTPAPDAVTGGERIVAVIPNATLKGGFMGMKSKAYTLVLTDRRIVFAQITTDMMKQIVADARDGAKAEGKGFMGQWGAQLTAYSAFAQGYLTMPVDQALGETPGNFAIERPAIEKAKVKVGHTDADNNTTADRLIIKTSDKKYDITLQAGAAQAKQALIAAELI